MVSPVNNEGREDPIWYPGGNHWGASLFPSPTEKFKEPQKRQKPIKARPVGPVGLRSFRNEGFGHYPGEKPQSVKALTEDNRSME